MFWLSRSGLRASTGSTAGVPRLRRARTPPQSAATGPARAPASAARDGRGEFSPSRPVVLKLVAGAVRSEEVPGGELGSGPKYAGFRSGSLEWVN